MTSLRLPARRGRLAAAVLAAALVASAAPASSQLPEDERVLEALLAWDRGDYPEAVRGWLDVLDAPDGRAHVAEIAALTGESFEVTELARDGRDLLVGADGRYAAWTATGPDGADVLRVVELPRAPGEPAREVAALEGEAASFSDGGALAYFAPGDDPALAERLAEAEAAMDAARAAGDRGAYFDAQGTARWLEAASRALRVRDLATGSERTVELGAWVPGDAAWAPGSADLYVVAGRPDDGAANEILRVGGDGSIDVLATGPGFKSDPIAVPGTSLLVYAAPDERPVPVAPGTATGESDRVGFGVIDVATGRTAFVAGAEDPVVSADGSRIAWLGERDGLATVESAPLDLDALSDHLGPAVAATEMDLEDPALSPDGRTVAYRKRPVDDWEVYVTSVTGGEERQVTWEIQHDLYPVFLDASTVMAMKGEGRHRRAFLYDLDGPASAGGLRLHHNNTLRTIAPEYEWAPLPDGSGVVLVSERDGDTVSPERGVYLVHLDRPVGLEALRGRLEAALAAEEGLRAKGEALYGPVDPEVRRVTERVDVGRIYRNAAVLYTYGSKYITQPGNRMASEYLAAKLRSWGYDVELQWFEPRGLRTANVIARLPGTVDPDVVYVVSSHYDSTERGPGADDDSSGTTALLEAARVMKDHPQPATVEFAFFTGEEAGLLGSREYVRRAVESGKRIVGALNNDMVGWANGPRLDNTIRYSNPGIRDIQHNAAMRYGGLITYDALYYKNTDAHAYYEEYGDIVGGIGSYPVLGNPHYHQFTDRLNTIDQRLVAAVSRTTVATLMLLASSPSRVAGLAVEPTAGGALRVRWDALPESTTAGYEVAWTAADGSERRERVGGTTHVAPDAAPGSTVRVRAFNERGMPSWDWARAEAPGGTGA